MQWFVASGSWFVVRRWGFGQESVSCLTRRGQLGVGRVYNLMAGFGTNVEL
jgi:hypothetical protein